MNRDEFAYKMQKHKEKRRSAYIKMGTVDKDRCDKDNCDNPVYTNISGEEFDFCMKHMEK